MPTVEEVLRQSGFSDDEIKGLNPKAITVFSGVLSTAEKERQEALTAREAAELAQRSNADFYDNQIAPALVGWADEKSKLDAELAYYRTQQKSLQDSGILPDSPARDGQGRYVTNAPGATPGSPAFDVNKVYERAGDAVGILTDIQWEHQRLFGQPLPLAPTELVRKADALKLDPRTYAARTFNWDARRSELEQKAKQAERDAIVREVEQRKDREWSERVGSNPDIRLPQNSRYSDVARAVKAGTLPDPLSLNEVERRKATAQAIRADIQDRNDAA
jgi:hypothetical protein